jgi:hypothetical protein
MLTVLTAALFAIVLMSAGLGLSSLFTLRG